MRKDDALAEATVMRCLYYKKTLQPTLSVFEATARNPRYDWHDEGRSQERNALKNAKQKQRKFQSFTVLQLNGEVK